MEFLVRGLARKLVKAAFQLICIALVRPGCECSVAYGSYFFEGPKWFAYMSHQSQPTSVWHKLCPRRPMAEILTRGTQNRCVMKNSLSCTIWPKWENHGSSCTRIPGASNAPSAQATCELIEDQHLTGWVSKEPLDVAPRASHSSVTKWWKHMGHMDVLIE